MNIAYKLCLVVSKTIFKGGSRYVMFEQEIESYQITNLCQDIDHVESVTFYICTLLVTSALHFSQKLLLKYAKGKSWKYQI